MQKVITLTVLADGSKPSVFDESKEVSELLKEGYKVISVTPSNAAQGFYSVFLIVLEKTTKKQVSYAV